MALDLATTERIAGAALARAQKMGLAFSVSIVDEAGNLVYVCRMDGAPFMSPQVATGKAFAASAFRRSSAELQQMAQTRPLFYSSFAALSQGRAIIGQGALPIIVEGKIVGAAGASGGTGEQDEEIVRAGLAVLG